MATMTLGEAMADLRDRLDEAPGDETSGVWTNVALRRCINRGVREVARRAECMEKTGTVSISAGTQSGTLHTSMPRFGIWRDSGWMSATTQRHAGFYVLNVTGALPSTAATLATQTTRYMPVPYIRAA